MVKCSSNHKVSNKEVSKASPKPWREYKGIYTMSCPTCDTSITIMKGVFSGWRNTTRDDMKKASKK